MRKVLLFGLGSLVLAVGAGWIALGVLVKRASRPIEAPYPPIQPDRSPAGVARGAQIFEVVCVNCHRARGAERAAGGRIDDVPAAMGEIYARNLTSDPEAGIGHVPDEVIARTIRYGIMRDGRPSVMPDFPMGDADLAALLGYLRSPSPLLAADPTVQPPSRPTKLGKVAFWLSHGAGKSSDLPARGIPTPVPTPTPAYGKYLAHGLYGCAFCHTPGFDSEKGNGSEAFSGGFDFLGPDRAPIKSVNITSDGTGLYLWTYADFARALREGLRPDGSPVFYPMPRYRVSDVELRALWAYLRSVPRKQSHFPYQRPIDWSNRLSGDPEEQGEEPVATQSARVLIKEPTGDQLFVQLGCRACHAVGAPYHPQWLNAKTRTVDYLVSWIRHPELLKPGTAMPTFASQLSVARARKLAQWALETPPEKLPTLSGAPPK